MKHNRHYRVWFAGICASVSVLNSQAQQPLLSYTFEQETVQDDSGVYPASLVNDAMIMQTSDGNHVLNTGSGNGYLDLGESIARNILSGLNGDYSVTLDLLVRPDNNLSKYCWVWALSNGTGQYMGLVNAAGNKGWYYEIKNNTAYNVNAGCGLVLDQWHTVTIVQKEGQCLYYLDGELKAEKAISLWPGAFAAGFTGNYLGKSPFPADAYMKNTLMDNFRIYGEALTADQVAVLASEKPVSSDLVLTEEQMRKVCQEELYLSKAVQYLHREVRLPEECTYGTVEWIYTPSAGVDGEAGVLYQDGLLTVTGRGETAVVVGTLQGRITYDGNTFDLYEQPLNVRVAPDDNAYGYLYCHMPNLVPQTGVGTLVSQCITYALGTEEHKGLVFNELNRGESIIDGIGSKLPWCRDAFLAKDKKRNCYYIVTTDLYGSLDNGTSMLGNYSIGMFKSYDLINWSYTRCDLKAYLRENPVTDIYDNTGTRLLTADKVSRVWAPQIVFIGGDPYIYYAVGNTDNGDCDHFYISRANEDFTGIETFSMLYGENKTDNVLDADINYLETDSLYHMSYRDYAGNGIIDITTADLLDPQWSQPVSSFQDGSGYEASSVFRRINDDVWNVGNVNYGNNVGYHFHTADALLRNLQPAPAMSGHLSPQHGSFIHVNRTEYDLLQVWSDLKALMADGATLNVKTGSQELADLISKAEQVVADDRGELTDLNERLSDLQTVYKELHACFHFQKALYTAQQANLSDLESRSGVADQMMNGGNLQAAIDEAQAVSEHAQAEELERQAGLLDDAVSRYYQTLKENGTKITIINGTFGSGTSGWTISGKVGQGNGVAEFFALRAVDYKVSMSQTKRTLDEGYYLVTCQAFERNGDNDYTGRDCREGVEKINYVLFANDRETDICSLYELPCDDNGSLNGFANTMQNANSLFSADQTNYANYVLIYLDEKTLDFGLKREWSTVTSTDWCCFDNFEIYHLDQLPTSIRENVGKDHLHGNKPIYDLKGVCHGRTDGQGRIPVGLPKGIYIIDGVKTVR